MHGWWCARLGPARACVSAALAAARRECRQLTQHRLQAAAAHTHARAGAMATAAGADKLFFLDAFALRQFDDPGYKGTRVDYDKEAFTARINELCTDEALLKPGYAPFCKHVFVDNFVGAQVGALTIGEGNAHLVRTDYHARTDKELPVLVRYFDAKDVEGSVPVAKTLDIILYSREQLVKENAAMGVPDADKTLPAHPWGIISIKAQDEAHELPMQPITCMRNALGREEGGSGVTLVREKYMESVAYWRTHAIIQY